MVVLLTGSRGRLGRRIGPALEAAGHEVVPFDLAHGDDVTDAAAVAAAARGVDAIVNAAGIPDDDADWELAPVTMPVNLLGTWNVLLAARAHGVGRVVHLSSGKALGMLERDPDQLPVDDRHRGLPSLPYALSKWLAEEMCEAFTRETGVSTICLRPVLVLDSTRYPALAAGPELPPVPGMRWHLGVWVDVDDVARAAVAAVDCPDPGHARLLLCADEIAAERPTAELVAEHLPDVPWVGPPLEPGSRRALVDCTPARELLGWEPRVRWADRARLVAEAAR
ncbi:NAD-dependent epimerase/dehydratase family protein [Conexibacter arvalis]|uniref:Nucleoside-diphosphate-sugar epimerase n=1 Tax=Conexibacter arvalis TaxID=912552 RepID=A0A840ICE3_9ACTN|nr:SDR family oxidoreductase [Conexibacter arvalis]MBB4661728.1 nucleoside-diphosphate-sugar epimerase [Conexibacter arvalis]